MTVKKISITDDAYDALLREKRDDESFTQTILRVAGKTGKLSDCFGSWKMADDEETQIMGKLQGEIQSHLTAAGRAAQPE